MVLFPSLSEWMDTTASTSSSSSSSVEPCTVVQLMETVGLNLYQEELFANNNNGTEKQQQHITYHAIQTQEDAMRSSQSPQLETRLPNQLQQQKQKQKLHVTPNIGIWNVPTSQSHILSLPPTSTFVWTCDLSTPHLLSSHIQSYQTATCQCFNQTTPPTTTCTFGQAPTSTTTTTLEEVPWKKGQLLLIGIVPSMKSNTTTTFQEKQIHCLIQYHLHKFASTMGATLVFVSTSPHTPTNNTTMDDSQMETNATTTTSTTGGMSISDFISILPTLCYSTTEETVDIPKHVQDFVHTEFDMEVIDSTMLRNASCPGLWDANTQSLTQVFSSLEPTEPLTTTTSTTSMNSLLNTSTTTNDQKWLQTLADSMSDIYNSSTDDAQSVVSKKSTTSRKSTKSNSKKPSSSSSSKASSSAPNDADVGSFFADLLKK